MLPDPAGLGSIPSIPVNFSKEKIINVAEFNPWHWLEESGQWLENVDQTHIVLPNGKPVAQQNIIGELR